MSSSVRKISTVATAVALSLFLLFVINQTAQVVMLADRISPLLGSVVLWTLLAAYTGASIYLGFQYVKLPKPLRPPASKDSPEYSRYLAALRARLRRNPLVQHMPLETEAHLEAALAELSRKADDVTRATALQVFLMTAVSQNGSLDALAVLASHSRMVWQIAHIFNQRPTVREMISLYSNVAVGALLSRQLEEMDLSDTLRPILSSVMPSAIGAVPGMEAAAIILTQSLMSGSANAYGTLRVGVIAKRYCGSLTMPDVSDVRRAAFLEAMKMIPSVAQDGAKAITGVVMDAVAKTMRDSVKKAGSTVMETAGSVTRRATAGAREVAQGAREAASAGMDRMRHLGRLWPFRNRSEQSKDGESPA